MYLVYVFHSVRHLERVLNLIKTEYKSYQIFYIILDKLIDKDLFKKIINRNKFIDIRLISKKNFEMNEIFKNSQRPNIFIIDKYISNKLLEIYNIILNLSNFTMIYLEHNDKYERGFRFSWYFGYFTDKSLFYYLNLNHMIFTIKLIYTFGIKNIFKIKLNPLDVYHYGLKIFSKNIYLYSEESSKYVQKKIDKKNIKIVNYDFSYLERLNQNELEAKKNKSMNVIIYSNGVFKTKNLFLILKFIIILINIIIKIKFKYRKKNINFYFKVKEKEKIFFINKYIMKFKIKNFFILKNQIAEINSYDLAIIPEDSFLVIEYLYMKLPFKAYKFWRNSYKPISSMIGENFI